MPARTNEFQELVSLIQTSLAPVGAQVTSSFLETPEGLSTPREIDILIKGQFGPYTLKIAVEAKDEGRRFDIGDFDSLLGKYRGEGRVCVDKFVIVSRRGFTKGVREKAKKADVELLTLDEAKGKNWSVATGQIRFQVKPFMHSCRIEPEPSCSIEELVLRGRMICPHGHDHGTPHDCLAHQLFAHRLRDDPRAKSDLDKQLKKEGNADLKVVWAHAGFFVRHGDVDYPVERLEVVFRLFDAIGPLISRVYDMESSSGDIRAFRYLEGSVAGKRIQLLVPADRPPERLILDIRNTSPSLQNRKARRAGRKKENKKGKRRHEGK